MTYVETFARLILHETQWAIFCGIQQINSQNDRDVSNDAIN